MELNPLFPIESGMNSGYMRSQSPLQLRGQWRIHTALPVHFQHVAVKIESGPILHVHRVEPAPAYMIPGAVLPGIGGVT